MPTLTIYVTTADLTMLNAIFNGVAMICSQTTIIWGFALLAAMWMILSTVTKATTASVAGNAQGVLPKGILDAIMPFIMAMLLTFPGFQSKVQVESTINGQVTVISNVPVVISIIPVTGSILSMEAGALVQTAYQSTGTNYPAISATGNGFINPLKVLLASRTALNRLNGVASEVDNVVTSCLGSDTGVNYSGINNAVSNAGNTGADATTSIAINGANPTALGALLYQASLNPSAFVGTVSASGVMPDCFDGANQAAVDIGTALQSAEFTRVVQGAVNGMDAPSVAGNVTIDNMVTQWNATRNANYSAVNNPISEGASQAQAEVINLLAGELVSNELNCISTSGSDRVVCEAALVQANEIERNNIQLAAAEVPMLKYAGSFGNYLLALIIGLGPIMVLFMMFAGVGASKCIKTVAHLIAWPLLVMNVGAELINGMIYISVANFAAGIANGGVISFAENFAIYKELSFQVGSASHMMASLPVLMGMIFALGESAALVNVGTNIAPKGSAVEDSTTPIINKQDAIFSQSGAGHTDHRPGGYETTLNGALPLLSGGIKLGEEISRSSSALSSSDSTLQTFSQSATASKDASTSFSKQDSKGWGLNKADAAAFSKFLSQNEHNAASYTTGNETSSRSDNSVTSAESAGFSAGGGVGGKDSGFHVGGTVGANTASQASSSLGKNIHAGESTALTKARDTGEKLDKTLSFVKTLSSGGNAVKDISNRIATHQAYTESLTNNQSASDTKTKALEASKGVTGYAYSNLNANQYASAIATNRELRAFNTIEGHKLDGIASIREREERISEGAIAGETSDIGGDAQGREAAIRFRAAVLVAQDESASIDDRYAAQKYVTGAMTELADHRIQPVNKPISDPVMNMARAKNETGQSLPVAVAQTTSSAAISPASHGSKHHATTHHHPAAHAGQIPDDLANASEKLKNDLSKPLVTGYDPEGTVRSMDKHATSQGLGANQEGTNVRAARVTVGAAKDLLSPKGTPSPVNYGDGGVAAAKAKAEHDAEAANHVGKTKNNRGVWQ